MISEQVTITQSEIWPDRERRDESPSGQHHVRLRISGLALKTEPFGAPIGNAGENGKSNPKQ